jgi:hypothetical protein
MFSASATSSSFTATVMGHLARTGASDISSILIAKHDVQLQDLLDVLGEKLVTRRRVQTPRRPDLWIRPWRRGPVPGLACGAQSQHLALGARSGGGI